MELLEQATLALEKWLISKERAIMMYMWYTKEQAEEEMEKIMEENTLSSNTTSNEDQNETEDWDSEDDMQT